MQIDVRDILAEAVGFNRTFKISGERPSLDDVRLTEDIEGEFTLTRIEGGLLARGRIATAIQLECHRCLRTFTRPVSVSFEQRFALKPGDDDLPISHHAIDLAPALQQEIVLSLPIKILDREDCPGIQPGAAVKYSK